MTTSYLFRSTQSVDTQSIQVSRLGTSSQPQPFQVNQLTLLIFGGGSVIAAVLTFWWWHKKRRVVCSRRNVAPVDWYQAEFGCSPLAACTKDGPPLFAPERADQVNPQPSLDDPSPPYHKEAASTSQETNPPSLSNRYATFIDQIITDTLKGRIRSKDYVYDRLVEQLQPGTGEIFERCLLERVNVIQHQLNCETDELKQSIALLTLVQSILIKLTNDQIQQLYTKYFKGAERSAFNFTPNIAHVVALLNL